MTEAQARAKRRSFLEPTYRWVMNHAEGPHAWWTLAFVAFAESSFFPIPPDIMLIPMALADRKRALLISLWATLFSVLGGMLGYAIGALLYQSLGHWLIDAYGLGQDLDAFRVAYAKWGAWIILIKGVTPIPYKLVTIASGFAGYDFWTFVALSAVTRFARFAIIAGLIAWFGQPVKAFIEKRLELALILVVAVCLAGFALVKIWF